MFPKQVRPRTGKTNPGMTYGGVPWRRGISRDRDGAPPHCCPLKPRASVSLHDTSTQRVESARRGLEPRQALCICVLPIVIRGTSLYWLPPWAWLCARCRDRTLPVVPLTPARAPVGQVISISCYIQER